MYIGYARVSTQDQHLDLQQDALQQAGCTRIIVDRVSGTVAERPGLAKLKEILRAEDTLVVWRLDRLGRSLKDLIAWVAWLEQEGIGLRSLHEALDTTTPSGKLTFHIFGALAEFERQLIQERTQAGLRVARARGRLGGRPEGAPGGQTAAGRAALPGAKDRGEADLCVDGHLQTDPLCLRPSGAVGVIAGHDTSRHEKGRRMPKKSREQKRADKTRARAKKRHQRQAQRPSTPIGVLAGRVPVW